MCGFGWRNPDWPKPSPVRPVEPRLDPAVVVGGGHKEFVAQYYHVRGAELGPEWITPYLFARFRLQPGSVVGRKKGHGGSAVEVPRNRRRIPRIGPAELQTTLPVVLSTAVPALPTSSTSRLSCTSGAPVNPQLGFTAPSDATRLLDHTTAPLCDSSANTQPSPLNRYSRLLSIVAALLVPPGPRGPLIWLMIWLAKENFQILLPVSASRQ